MLGLHSIYIFFVLDYIDPACIMCQNFHEEEFNLETLSRESLNEVCVFGFLCCYVLIQMIFNFRFVIMAPCLIHGLAAWFDIYFDGTDKQLGFSTSPWSPPTHWYYVTYLLNTLCKKYNLHCL